MYNKRHRPRSKSITCTIQRKDKTLEEYLQYLVGGVAIGTPEKVLQGIKKYIDIGVTHFILHFIGLDEATLDFLMLK